MKRSFGISLILHVALFAWLLLGLKYSGQNPQTVASKKMTVRTLTQKDFENQLKDALESNEVQIVQSDEQMKNEESPSEKTKLRLSRSNQIVDRETRAAKNGRFHNDYKEAIQKLFTLTPNPKDTEQERSLVSKTGRLFSGQKTNRKPSSAPGGEGASATDDYLPDIAVGVNTLLNTKEYKFYGFFERIRERLTNVWQAKLREEFDRVSQHGMALAGDHITKVQVKLDPKGALKSLSIVGASGISGFDQAATEAFRSAAPFPNPPTQMIESDESVSIRWDFVVVASEDSGVQIHIERGNF